MKRSVAFMLTAVIFAAIAVCFLRPAPSQIGYPQPFLTVGERLELSGDVEYFEYAEVLAVDYIDGTIDLKLPPVEPYVLLIGARVNEYGMAGEDEGYVEKLVDGEWVYLREAGLGGVWTLLGGPPSYFSLVPEGSTVRSKYGQLYRLGAHKILFEPGDYRFNLNFRQIENDSDEVGDVITISFVITVPYTTTDKKYDVYIDGNWGGHIAIRSNDGSPAPYLVSGSPIKVTDSSGKTIFDGELNYVGHTHTAFDDSYLTVPREKHTVRAFGFDFKVADPLPRGEYEISLEFSENKDGSGERYPFTYTTTLGR